MNEILTKQFGQKVSCPRCGKRVVYSAENKFRPFCSERCKLIDLGTWAEEKYRIPVQDTASIDQEFSEDSEKMN